MLRLIIRRIGSALVTLALLSVVTFALANVLPGSIGRAVLGGFASQQSVDQLNRELGVDRPLVEQYRSWVSDLAQGDMGTSLQYRVPVWDLVGPSLLNSLKLALLALIFIVPVSLGAGVLAAFRRDKKTDRIITVTGLSMTAIPEFVSAIVLIVLFGVVAGILPVSAAAAPDAGFAGNVEPLILPALALGVVYFGYVSRMTRAGVIEVIAADYTRTAYLKGLRTNRIVAKHILRNAVLPTIAVLTTQMAHLVGGLLVIETLFNYDGIGRRLYTALQNKDFLVIEACVLIIGTIVIVSTAVGDILYAWLNPRIRYPRDRS